MQDEILTVPQTAVFLKVCEKTVRRLIDKKQLTASKVGGGWRIQRKDIDEYLFNNQNRKRVGKIK